MGIRTGAEYLASLRDGRRVYMDGALVEDVTTDPRLAGGARTVASLYDMQHDPELCDDLTFVSPSTGNRVARAFMQPATVDELKVRSKALRIIADRTYGMIGRSPDFVSIALTALASASRILGASPYGHDFGANMRNYFEYVRENDLALTHVQVNPQVDRSKGVGEQSQDIALHVVKETEAGFYVRGAKLVGTLSQLANELLVLPSVVVTNAPDADKYAVSFALPMAAEGIKLLGRPSVVPQGVGHFLDNPLSLQLDEGDAVIVFDDVFVPWDRCFVYRDPARCSRLFVETFMGHHMNIQSVIRGLAKTEFLAGLAIKLAKSTNVDGFLNVQNELARILMVRETQISHIERAQNQAVETDFGTVAPDRFALLTAQNFYFEHFNAMIETIRSLGAGGIVAVPSYAELSGPVAEDVQTYYITANQDTEERIRLYRLAADLCMSGFAGRQQLYERFYQGDPLRRAGQYYMTYAKDDLIGLVDRAMDGMVALSRA